MPDGLQVLDIGADMLDDVGLDRVALFALLKSDELMSISV
jgi:hypothetical protein